MVVVSYIDEECLSAWYTHSNVVYAQLSKNVLGFFTSNCAAYSLLLAPYSKMLSIM